MATTKKTSGNGTAKAKLGTLGGIAAGAAAGSLLGPVSAAVGAVVGGMAAANAASEHRTVASRKKTRRAPSAFKKGGKRG